jgi:hypothetical protein
MKKRSIAGLWSSPAANAGITRMPRSSNAAIAPS